MKIRRGDTFVLENKKQNAYIQFLEKDKRGELTRIFFSDKTDSNLEFNFNAEEVFFKYFFLRSEFNNKTIKYIGNFHVENYLKPKFMRSKHLVRKDLKGWHIINIETLERKLVKSLSKDQINLSPFGIANSKFIKEMMNADWKLKKWI